MGYLDHLYYSSYPLEHLIITKILPTLPCSLSTIAAESTSCLASWHLCTQGLHLSKMVDDSCPQSLHSTFWYPKGSPAGTKFSILFQLNFSMIYVQKEWYCPCQFYHIVLVGNGQLWQFSILFWRPQFSLSKWFVWRGHTVLVRRQELQREPWRNVALWLVL